MCLLIPGEESKSDGWRSSKKEVVFSDELLGRKIPVVDAMVLARQQNNLPLNVKTLKDFSSFCINKIANMASHYNEVHVGFDDYIVNSLKERQKHSAGMCPEYKLQMTRHWMA